MVTTITEKMLSEGVFIRIYRDGERYVFHAIDDDSGETIARYFCPSLGAAERHYNSFLAEEAKPEGPIIHSTAETTIQTSLFN